MTDKIAQLGVTEVLAGFENGTLTAVEYAASVRAMLEFG